MKISYAILTHNEGAYIEQLLSFLSKNLKTDDEIVVVDDYSDDELSKAILEEYEADGLIKLFKHSLENNFSNQKNFLNSVCSGDFIFQIDADELPSQFLLDHIHEIIELNSIADVYLVPRINVVDGITDEHIKKWNWKSDSNGWINFPDYQWRIYRNSENIYWINKVHERLDGFEVYTALPPAEEYCLYHKKHITRQEIQNDFYDKI